MLSVRFASLGNQSNSNPRRDTDKYLLVTSGAKTSVLWELDPFLGELTAEQVRKLPSTVGTYFRRRRISSSSLLSHASRFAPSVLTPTFTPTTLVAGLHHRKGRASQGKYHRRLFGRQGDNLLWNDQWRLRPDQCSVKEAYEDGPCL